MAQQAMLQPAAVSEGSGPERLLEALRHLHSVLPLKRRQESLPPHLRSLHRFILRSLAEQGHPPRRAEIAAMLGSERSALNALAVLGTSDLVVLNSRCTKDAATKRYILEDPEGVEIVGAYPMTTAKTPHEVKVFGQSIHAMCALDALAIAPMFCTETWIESRCHETGNPVRIHQNDMKILEARPAGVYFGIRWQKVEGCAARGLCKEMVFLDDVTTARAWQDTDPEAIEVFSLREALEFGAAFFVPLVEEERAA